MASTALATSGESRLGADGTRRILEIANDPSAFDGKPEVVKLRDLAGRLSFQLQVDDEDGFKIAHLRVWRGRGGLGGVTDRFRASPGFAMWSKANALVAAGIATPPPFVVAERRRGSLEWSCFASEQIDAAIGLDQVLQNAASWSEARQTNFARNLAFEFKKLRHQKLGVAELSPSTFLVRGVPDFEFELFVCEPDMTTVGGEISAAQIESRILFGFPPKALKAFFRGLG